MINLKINILITNKALPTKQYINLAQPKIFSSAEWQSFERVMFQICNAFKPRILLIKFDNQFALPLLNLLFAVGLLKCVHLMVSVDFVGMGKQQI